MDEGTSYLAKTCHGAPVCLLTLAVTFQAHGPVGKLTHLPERDQDGDACIIDRRAEPH